MKTFQYIQFEQPLTINGGEHLLYAPDGSEVQHVRDSGTTTRYKRLYSEAKRTYVYREVYTNSRRPS